MVVDSFIDPAHHSDFIADREADLHSNDSQSRHGREQLHRPSPPPTKTCSVLDIEPHTECLDCSSSWVQIFHIVVTVIP
ncbi:hypothetical protein RRG08_063418 [Elysia crispata]|uniref:Uncharacterized protein n=1 Tax=Elysia crispata TaxID=231223 RepID=A0AAE1AAL4_9GAST|nr:hypothetical protein RRG08_063418 [Elysia crispata]